MNFEKFWDSIKTYYSASSSYRTLAKMAYEVGFKDGSQKGEFRSAIQIQFRKLPDYGDKFTLEEFIDSVKNTAFTNDDGTGYYGFENMISNVYARPSDIYKGDVDNTHKWTHVVWFNK